MTQARTLDEQEIQQLLEHVSKTRHAVRNRAMVLLTHWAGLRVGEVACLRWRDVIDSDGRIKDEIRLLPDMTKGRHARTVFVSAKLQHVLQEYADSSQAKSLSNLGSVPIVLDRPSPYSTAPRAFKAQAATVAGDRF
jgi:integrase/recombinase XerD